MLLGPGIPAGGQTNRGAAAAIEWSGGAAGSAIGVGIGLLVFDPGGCGEDDVGCVLNRLAGVGLTTAVTAPLAAWSAGRAFDTEPHGPGVALGGIAGAVGGVGTMRLLSEVGLEPRGPLAVVVYAVAQGLFTAAGSRIGAEMRDD